MDEAYDNVVPSKLKLKKRGLTTTDKKSKKKRKVEKAKEKDTAQVQEEISVEDAEVLSRPPEYRHMTKAEYRFELRRQKNEAEQMKSLAKTSHRERIKQLNEKLDKLPQHFDLPKVALTIG
eukprot:c32265_g1_i1.p2 GENE.c32265_g1_i1~~c32265_g1_i1.p2  ORF type:complete len:130 (+),score=34.18 c32265_g1_i1:29-391(+)